MTAPDRSVEPTLEAPAITGNWLLDQEILDFVRTAAEIVESGQLVYDEHSHRKEGDGA